VTSDAGTEAARCVVCNGVLRAPARRGRPRLTCSNRCRQAYNRSMRGQPRVTGSRSRNAGPGDVQYREPPRPPETGSYGGSLADARFRAQYEQHAEAEKPLTPIEKSWLAQQKRNPGVLIEPLRQIQIDRARTEQRQQAEEAASHQPLRPESPLDPGSLGSVGRKARYDRAMNKPADQARSILRPLDRHPGPPDDDNQCVDAPWSRGRW
jgi:hypothetical protein